jgi:hypothetical protein
LVIISYTTGLSFALERIGPLAAITIIVFYLLILYLLALPIPLKTRLLVFTVNPWSKPLVNTFCSSLDLTLLFIESTTIHPLYLWVITCPCPYKTIKCIEIWPNKLKGSWMHFTYIKIKLSKTTCECVTFFEQRRNATRERGHNTIKKVTTALRMLAYGIRQILYMTTWPHVRVKPSNVSRALRLQSF